MTRHASFRHVLLSLFALLTLPVCLAAQEELSFSADRTSSVFAEGREEIVLLGDARVAGDDFEIAADEIRIVGDGQRYVLAEGNVSLIEREQDLFLSSEELFFDREEDYLRARGGAYMEDRENVVVVKGELIQNWSEIDLTEISVNVRILGEDYTARGQFARYRRDADTLELAGSPEVFWQGDQYRASRINIDLERDEIDFVGDVEATVRRDADDESEEPAEATEEAAEPEQAPQGESE
jgi:lipopolysaccharide export system protein LptA